jgi:hypothetical protein
MAEDNMTEEQRALRDRQEAERRENERKAATGPTAQLHTDREVDRLEREEAGRRQMALEHPDGDDDGRPRATIASTRKMSAGDAARMIDEQTDPPRPYGAPPLKEGEKAEGAKSVDEAHIGLGSPGGGKPEVGGTPPLLNPNARSSETDKLEPGPASAPISNKPNVGTGDNPAGNATI